MSGTISGPVTSSYTLSVNPTTVAPSGTISASSGAALYGSATTAWSVINQGGANAAAGVGIAFAGGGTISNQTGAQIYGAIAGVSIAGGAAYVSNAGTIEGSITTFNSPGVLMGDGGTVTNAGRIGGYSGVLIGGGAGTVINSGGIAAGLAASVGVSLGAGGYVSNAATALIDGYLIGISLAAAGTVVNAGSIFAGFEGRAVEMAGGLLDNQTGGYIAIRGGRSGPAVLMEGGGTVLNAGTIQDEGAGGPMGVGVDPGGTVSNAAGGLIAASDFGVYSNGAVSVTNSGSIIANGSVGRSTGVGVGGFVSNAAGAFIGGTQGVYLKASPHDTLLNAGTIQGTTAAGVLIGSPGLVSNASSGIVSGYDTGIEVNSGAGITVVNQGNVTATGTAGIGVYLMQKAALDNAGGTVGGATGVQLRHGGTVTNAGTIAATGTGDAVGFAAGYANRLVVDPGAAFTGTVDGGNTAGASITSVLEFSGSGAALAGLGDSVVNFGSIDFDVGAAWEISGAPAGLAAGQTISGFTIGDTIDLVGVSDTIAGFAAGTLTLGGSASLDLLLPGSFTAASQFHAVSAAGDTAITVACFAAGTRIATPNGELPVETLRVGDRVVSAFGRTPAVTWVGHRRIDCRRHPRPREVWPVRVRRGAFGEGQPHADLWLSPDHAVYTAGCLIPIRYLLNGTTIVQEQRDSVAYYHLELSRHEVLLAEGLPCESYLDTGNRGAFDNGGAPILLHADFALGIWQNNACAPLVRDGSRLAAARSQLLERAELLGFAITRDAALHAIADNHPLHPELAGRTYRFRLPANAHAVRLVSRSATPAETCSDNFDHRRLGVAVSRLTLDGKSLPLTDPRLHSGWHEVETDGAGTWWRWTDGDSALALASGRVLDLKIVMTGRYWVGKEHRPARQTSG